MGVVRGETQGQMLEQRDFTEAQYASLGMLVAALIKALPRVRPDYPRVVSSTEGDGDGTGGGGGGAGRELVTHRLAEETFRSFEGVLGHFHVQSNKIDPGPAFQWERMLRDVKEYL